MDTEDRNTISFSLGCDPVVVDAMYVSPMKRPRLYWSNIPGLGNGIGPKWYLYKYCWSNYFVYSK